MERRELFKLPEGFEMSRALTTTIPDLPDVDIERGFAQQDANEEKINALLDDVAIQVSELKELAEAMGEKIETTTELVEEVGIKVEDANTDLDNINESLKTTLADIRKPSKFLCDCCLILLLVGLGYVIYTIVKQKTRA
eukprot:TRINITY_DN3003_c0_g2_i1.p1 TRINITY_DN3003_c0_g2~~TRINITY_DN3003_c0_g2_i1.p1  ORF type:complete len:152 (-),score=12.72 TRINITY_DN3003_c0_g2_i1:31-447(-)